MTTPVPVTSVTLDDLKTSNPGASLADQLDKLPQLVQTESAQRSSGALFGNAGGTYINLRGSRLPAHPGAARRFARGAGRPRRRRQHRRISHRAHQVRRHHHRRCVAQYGADAVGGVVNFVLDRNFEGMKVSASTGITEEGDGWNHKASIAGGMRFGEKLHVVASAEYNHIDQIMRDPTKLGDWFQRYGYVTNPAFVAGTATPQRLTLPNVISSVHSPYGRIDTAYPLNNVQTAAGVPFTLRNTVFLDDGSGVRPFISGGVTSGAVGTQSMAGGSEFDAGSAAFPGGPYGAQVDERSTFLGLKYDINDRLSVFGQAPVRCLGIEPARPARPAAPAGHLVRHDLFRQSVHAGERAVGDDRAERGSFKMLKLGQLLGEDNWNDHESPRNSHAMFTWAAGVEADIFADWHLRAMWQSGKSHKYTAVLDELRVDRMFLALDAVTVTAANVGTSGLPIGSITCNVKLVNPKPAQLAAAVAPRNQQVRPAIAFTGGPRQQHQRLRAARCFRPGQRCRRRRATTSSATRWASATLHQDFAEALVSGKVFDGWAGPVSAALGVTYSKEDFIQRAYPDELERVGPPLNAGGARHSRHSVGIHRRQPPTYSSSRRCRRSRASTT